MIILKEISTFIKQGSIKLTKCYISVSISNKCCSFNLSINQKILKMYYRFTKKCNIKQQHVFNTDNNNNNNKYIS